MEKLRLILQDSKGEIVKEWEPDREDFDRSDDERFGNSWWQLGQEVGNAAADWYTDGDGM